MRCFAIAGVGCERISPSPCLSEGVIVTMCDARTCSRLIVHGHVAIDVLNIFFSCRLGVKTCHGQVITSVSRAMENPLFVPVPIKTTLCTHGNSRPRSRHSETTAVVYLKICFVCGSSCFLSCGISSHLISAVLYVAALAVFACTMPCVYHAVVVVYSTMARFCRRSR